ncbi:MAG: molybdenum cofactor guanylyltransferase [Georgenia sp.]
MDADGAPTGAVRGRGFDAIVLAGGTARRLDGVSKPDVELGGRRLLDHALAATSGARAVAVVAPDSVRVPEGVHRTLEDPPHGGPEAGIAAGIAALDAGAPDPVRVPEGVRRTLEDPPHGGPVAGIAALDAGARPAEGVPEPGSAPGTRDPMADSTRDGAPWVLVLACDVPFAAGAVPRLLDAVAADAEVDGACLRDSSGYLQWLVGVYRTGSLRASLTALGGRTRGASVKALVAPLTVVSVAATGHEALDVDTWEDLGALEE